MSTIICTDYALELDLQPEKDDIIRPIRGVGGVEYVYEKRVDIIKIDIEQASDFKLQVGAMDYGFNINAIIGYDLLSKAKIIIDTGNYTLFFKIGTVHYVCAASEAWSGNAYRGIKRAYFCSKTTLTDSPFLKSILLGSNALRK